MKKNIGLYFGSFNPIHIGHLVVAEYFATQTDLSEIWLVVSPQNPLKGLPENNNETARVEMARLAIAGNPLIKLSEVEFTLPRPSFTCDTLRKLNSEYPDYSFTLLMGEDNMHEFHLWKDYLFILNNFPIRIYPRYHKSVRSISKIDWHQFDVKIESSPRIEISSTIIRRLVNENKSIRYLVPDSVSDYIRRNGEYVKK